MRDAARSDGPPAIGAADALVSRWVLPTSLFLGTFAWSFTFVSLPFYVERLSTLDDAAATLRWSGWILGITPLITVATAPLWGRLAAHVSSKRLYVVVEVLQGIGFFGMALARTLPELLLARMLLGIMGAASTFAFIIVGRAGGDVRRDVSTIQSGMTVGQVLGPLAGAVVAARVGFTPSFVISGLILWGCALLVWLAVPAQATREVSDRRSRASLRDLTTVCLLVLTGSTQVFFLPAILPQILPPLGVAHADSLEAGGLIIFATGVAAALGAFAAPRLGDVLGDPRSVTWLLAGSSAFLAALALAPEVWSFGALRFLQVLVVAPVFPLAVAAIAPRASGEAIGFVNSSRIGAAFVGPVVATTLLAWGRPSLVYVTLAGVGLALLPLLRRGSARYPSGESPR